jgi:glucans biosynthesis protein
MKRMSRLFALATGLVLLSCGTAAESKFDFATLRARAWELAAKPYQPARSEVPAWLNRLTYDEHRLIEFGGQNSLWLPEKLPFMVQYLHPGFLHGRTVHLFELHRGLARPIPFRRDHFNYRSVKPGQVPETLGFAGFRLMFPFGGPSTRHNEIGSFVGASYFRFLSRGQWLC